MTGDDLQPLKETNEEYATSTPSVIIG